MQLQKELLSGPALMTSAELKVLGPPQACLRGIVRGIVHERPGSTCLDPVRACFMHVWDQQLSKKRA